MSESRVIGDPDGIKLWSIMSKSDDSSEQEIFKRLNSVAPLSGRVFFSDIVTQRELNSNQTIWKLEWNGKSWEISLFHIPDGAKRVSDRVANFGVEKKVDISNLISE